MVTFSLCMIVKNEESLLRRCLDSFCRRDLFDEVVIVDTGSEDETKRIAAEYTEKIYDFEWVDDFSAARNFAFSKCTADYIYSCDADEILDDENLQRFLHLKEAMLEKIEIVQMYYVEKGLRTVLNKEKEYRGKLFKRLRPFTWQDPVHETVRLEPVVFDSDIEIMHCPEGDHGGRDFSIFLKAFERGERFTKTLYYMYATELFKVGTKEDYAAAVPVFLDRLSQEGLEKDAFDIANCVLARAFRLNGETEAFFKYALHVIADGGCSDICHELGEFYRGIGDRAEADLWYYNAVHETEPLIDASTHDPSAAE